MKSINPETIRDAVQSRAEEIIEWTKALIRFPSENRPPNGNEAAVQKFIEDECRKLELGVDVFAPDEIPDIANHPSWLPGRIYDNDRQNVVARWKGKGDGKSILFSGHADVAPFEPDNWKSCRPYEPVVKDGRLYGRGSADMKGGLATAFWALRILQELGFEPAGDILFESVVDEEYASGNGTLASRLRGHNADLAIVAEPTCMQICPACFGAFLGELTLTGQAGMPYAGTAIPNPINGAARAIELFAEWEKQWRRENSHPLFNKPGKELNVLLWQVDSAKPGEFTQMGTPLATKISWIVWCHPGMTETEFYQRFRAYWEKHAKSDPALTPFELRLEPAYHFVKPWETPVDSPAVQAVVEAFSRCEKHPDISGMQASCDLAIYGEVGRMPAVLLGPRGDNMHAPDEWVELEDILTLTKVYANIALTWCQKPDFEQRTKRAQE